MIPGSIERGHILEAAARIDSGRVQEVRPSRAYDVVVNGRRYPPKHVVSIAAQLATGRALAPNEFWGGTETNEFLRRLGFEVVQKLPTQRARADGVGHRDRILAHVTIHPSRCDDCVAAALDLAPRQTVNLHARALQALGAVTRERGTCARCGGAKVVNAVGTGAPPARVTTLRRGGAPILDGASALDAVLRRAGYGSVVQAVAEHTVFLHPDTVAQTRGEAVFPVGAPR